MSVLSPDVVNPEGLPLQVTVAPEEGELGVHCATAASGANGSAPINNPTAMR